MRKVLVKMGGALLAVLLLLFPISAFAAPDTDVAVIPEEEVVPTGEMIRSERYIRSILSERNTARQATLFSEFVNTRIKYATARSLCRTDGGKWMGYVDIMEAFENGKSAGFLLQQGTVQYGYQKLPTGTAACDLSIGSVSKSLEYTGQTLFSFPSFELEADALEGDVALNVTYYNAQYDIPLVQNYPGAALEKDEALKAMAPAYVAYSSEKESL